MKPNIGKTDRMIRIILGVFVLSLTVWGPGTWWGLLGIIPLATALVNFCPLYTIFKRSTLEQPMVKTVPLKK
jgi:hypothetical protein